MDTQPVTGKTKRIEREKYGVAKIVSMNALTKGDGATSVDVENKGIYSTSVAVSCFMLLNHCGEKTAFISYDPEEPDAFRAVHCNMVPMEVIGCRLVHPRSSRLKRNPDLVAGQRLDHLAIDFHLKTTGKQWTSPVSGTVYTFDCDDPITFPHGQTLRVYHPREPYKETNEHQTIPLEEFSDFGSQVVRRRLRKIEYLATRSFLILEYALSLIRVRLYDSKFEFGMACESAQSMPILADVIDCDSWRAYDEVRGIWLDKQGFRDETDTPEDVHDKYKYMAEYLEQHFRNPEFMNKVRRWARENLP